ADRRGAVSGRRHLSRDCRRPLHHRRRDQRAVHQGFGCPVQEREPLRCRKMGTGVGQIAEALCGSATPVSRYLSPPKESISVLLLEGVNPSAVELMTYAGYTNVTRLAGALDADALREAIRGVDLIGIRSRTQLDERFFSAAERLLAVGCFSVGTNQVDIDAARRRGIPVFNAPFSNTRSVAGLVIREVVLLLPRI